MTAGPEGPFLVYCSLVRASFLVKRFPSYEARLEADRQAQHSGYGIQPYHCADGTIKWEAYGWERITELQIHTTSYGVFDHKWEAEQYFNRIVNS